ncbi:MAG TPA: helix-turn-helix domain-containing protein [Verrucomicrobiae bacterium]|nr:helix-turn-helix domain-containing protein [Verrucomicrobiae bacterium]
MATADLLLHPVRLRILQAFLGERALTTTQLAVELADVPTGSLYRHVAQLTRAGVLQVVAERRVRAVVERTYTLRLLAAQVGAGEAAGMTPGEHAHAFMAFVAGLLADFDRYLAAGRPDLLRDGVSYGMSAMWLTDAEHSEFLRDVRALIQPRLAQAPAPGRRRRLVSSVMLPAPEERRGVAASRGRSRRAPPHRLGGA